jgi:hypothetical protein
MLLFPVAHGLLQCLAHTVMPGLLDLLFDGGQIGVCINVHDE